MILPFQAATFFQKPKPKHIPKKFWKWLCHRFYYVDKNGNDCLIYPPSWIPYRAWRLLSKGFFTIDIYKHKTFQENAPRTIREIFDLAPQSWIIFGTLLGCIRDGAIIPWDRDIDIGISTRLVTEELIKHFEDHGFKVEKICRFERKEYEKIIPSDMGNFSKIVLRKGAKVEFYCFARGLDGRLYYGENKKDLFGIDYDLNFPLKEVEFCESIVKVPVAAEENLRYVYGDGWRMPKPLYINSKEHISRQKEFFQTP